MRTVHGLYLNSRTWSSSDVIVYDKMTSSCHIASQRIRELLRAFFNIKCGIYINGEQDKDSINLVRMG